MSLLTASVANHPACQSYYEGRRDRHKTRGGRDRGQARDHAGSDAEHAGLALEEPFGHAPSQRRRGRREMRRRKRAAGQRAGVERAAGIETKPAHPQKPRANQAQDDIVRGHRLAGETDPLSQHQRADQRRDARTDMHHHAAGEIQHGIPAVPGSS